MSHLIIRLLLGLALLAMAGCATRQPMPSVESACLAQFEQLDEQLHMQGMHDAGGYRIPGYPYLRFTRFMASFRYELDTPDKRRLWLGALREEDQAARKFELQNLGQSGQEHLDVLNDCGEVLLAGLLQDESRFNHLIELAVVPDDYSVLARVLGLYPLAVPFMQLGVQRYQTGIHQDYATDLTVPDNAGLQTWAPAVAYADNFPATEFETNALGIPQITPTDWEALGARYAPAWQVEVAGVDDQPGAIRLQNRPVVDSSRVVTYLDKGFTRFEGAVMPQLSYVLWFPRRTAINMLDAYAGEFDAVVWRVTLGLDGRPVAYDTMHACGCYQYFYPVRLHTKAPDESLWREPILIPQSEIPTGRVMLRLQAGTHYLRRVLPFTAAATGRQQYAIKPYDELRSLPLGGDQYRNLFSGDGLLKGSERLERFWLWPSGVISPGAMRQMGRHATAFIGRRHFDDPYLLEEVFTRKSQ